MPDDDRPIEPNEENPDVEPPAAVQWMIEQATAEQPALPGALPGAVGLLPAAVPAANVPAARERRIDDALRGSDRLFEAMDGATSEALLGLGLEMGRVIVRDTVGLTDPAAEEILQPRVRAVRRFMMAVGHAAVGHAAVGHAAVGHAAATETGADEWLNQAAIALGDRFIAPHRKETAAFEQRWQALSGRPVEQIVALRRFIEDHMDRRS